MGHRRPKNLLLDEVAVRRGERYCALHGGALSRLVEEYLLALPDGEPPEVKSPIVRELAGVAAHPPTEPDAYRRYLDDTYHTKRRGGVDAAVVRRVKAPKSEPMPIVIAPDVILDLICARGQAGEEAALLFDAIAADARVGTNRLPAYATPLTVSLIHYLAWARSKSAIAGGVTFCLLRLLMVAPLNNDDYAEALLLHNFPYEDALQFVACRCVGAKYLVSGDDFGPYRMPVQRRTAGEVVAGLRTVVSPLG